MTYHTALEEIVQEISSLQRFVEGCIFVFTSEKLVLPLINSILARIGTGVVGLIHLQEILEDTFRGRSRELVSICNEMLTNSFDLSDAQETSLVLFNLVSSLMKLDFDSFVAPYCKYKSSFQSSEEWRTYSQGLRLENNQNIR